MACVLEFDLGIEVDQKFEFSFISLKKTLLVNYSQKYCLKVPASLIFCEIPADQARTSNNGRWKM